MLLVVRLAVVHDVSGASAQSSAAERRLMVWPLGCEKGLHTSFPSDPLGMQSCRQHKMCVKSVLEECLINARLYGGAGIVIIMKNQDL